MSKEVNKEQTKAAKQEKSAELSDDQLEDAAGGVTRPLDNRTDDDYKINVEDDDQTTKESGQPKWAELTNLGATTID